MDTIENTTHSKSTVKKTRTGIQGFDEVTGGGLPDGRTTLVCGGPGCGKTIFGIEFLVRGATEFGEPGVFVAFEETADELVQNVRSMGFDLGKLVAEKQLRIDHIRVERSEIEETGEYDLEGLFVRLGYAIDSIGAKRIVLDTLESLFSGFSNVAILRSELRRLFRWLKERSITAIITAERGDGNLTRHGLEEYVSDCVILLDHRVTEQLSTRRLRIVKYRGSGHDTNEFPFLIDSDGISVVPITSSRLEHEAPTERISTGIARLDGMLSGQGYYRGASVLISGTAGTGKTSIAAHFAAACCARGERCLYFAFEESPKQLVRNMHSIGLDLQQWIDQGLLQIHSARPSLHGLEMHLAVVHKAIREFGPKGVVIDPISNFISAGTSIDSRSMLTRLVDFLKSKQITTIFTSLIGTVKVDENDVGISSIIDTWLQVRDLEMNGERNRGLYLLKSRGMSHSNQIREFLMTDQGIELADIYFRQDGMLCGSSRVAQDAADAAESLARLQIAESRTKRLDTRRKVVDAQIEALRAEFQAEEDEVARVNAEELAHDNRLLKVRSEIAKRKGADIN
jgi:circadian clock protein KaiC